MKVDVIVMLFLVGGFSLGAMIGLTFGKIQNAAFDRYRHLQNIDRLPNAGAIVPGSLRRVALLLLSLIAIQIAFPMLFEKEGMQWTVSGGVVIGYGWALLKEARRRQDYRV